MFNNDDLKNVQYTIWKDIGVKIKIKETFIRKIGEKVYHRFHNTYGDVPVAVMGFGKITEVVNLRGRAYAARKHQMYRRKPEKPVDWD